METANLDELIAEARNLIGAIIQKPKMTEKLLGRPPFRFLHDTISAVIITTGFGEGLYSAEEMDCSTINEKQAKIDYLDKIFNLVGICKGSVINVRAGKVVAGQEPENTNIFLIALAQVAVDGGIDSPDAVRRTLSLEQPGTGSIPRKKMAESKGEEPKRAAVVQDKESAVLSSSAQKSTGRTEIQADSKSGSDFSGPVSIDDSKGSVSEIDSVAGERGKSRGGSRAGKPTQPPTADVGLKGITAVNLDAHIELCDGSEEATQRLLGDLITKPKLTSKLLSKPPVRFLHDIISEVIKVTGFGSGLYNETELDAANMTEKAAKMNFLDKMIKLVGIQLNTIVEAKSAKIVSGLEAQSTNHFLQLLAVAAKHVPNSRLGVRSTLEAFGEVAPISSLPVQPVTAPPPSSARGSGPAPAPIPVGNNRPGSVEVAEEKAAPRTSEPPSRVMSAADDQKRESATSADDKPSDFGDGENRRSARPSTAGRRPPKIKDGVAEAAAKEVPRPVSKKAGGILLDGQGDDDDDDMVPLESRLADEVKADEKSSATGGGSSGDPQSKLVKDILSRQAEQEAVAGGLAHHLDGESKEGSADAAAGSGGIRLNKRLKKPVADRLGAAAGATASHSQFGETEIERMRGAVQTLVQHTGPLGTCMDFIQEDIGLMSAELRRWEEECRRYEAQAEEEKLKSRNILQPLHTQIADIDDQINEKIARISSSKTSIAKNEERIQQIMKLMISS